MPPRARKQDPEALKKAFDEWKLSKEYELWKKLAEELNKKQDQYKFKDLDIVTDLYNDLQKEFTEYCQPWQPFLNDLFEFTKLLKVKTKLKEYKFEWWRGCQFARDKETVNNHRPAEIDKVMVVSAKEASDEARSSRLKLQEVFKDLAKILETDADECISENNFQTIKKSLQKGLTEFNKYFYKYQFPKNKMHADVYEEKLFKVLEPLGQLLNCNARLSYFEYAYKTPEDRQAASFKEKVLIDHYCTAYQNFQKVLHEIEQRAENRVKAPIEMQRIINKFNYDNWQNKEQEKFYLKPLKIIYFQFRKNMCQLHSKGVDYWRVPMGDNYFILKDVQQMVDAELIAENLLGNSLKRDQLEFTYDVLNLIYKSPTKEKLLAKEHNILQQTIPDLIIFKTLQKMRHILNIKIEEIEKQEKLEQENQTQFQPQATQQIQNNESLLKVSYFVDKVKAVEDQLNKSFMKASMLLSPQKSQYFSSPASPAKGKLAQTGPIEDEETKEQRELDAEVQKYGRFWIWENFVDPKFKDLLLDGAERLRHIHFAVQQDIQDYIIGQGLVSKPVKGLKDQKYQEEKKRKQDLERKDNENKENVFRPPELWNHPKVEIEEEKEHQFRSIANIKQIYTDNRVQKLYDDVIKVLREHIFTFQKEHWSELISRVIDIFNDHYLEKPNEELEDEKTNYNLKRLNLYYQATAAASQQAAQTAPGQQPQQAVQQQ